MVWVVYTYYYTERSTADPFRFFDDAKIMHEALFEDPGSYLRMMFGYDVDNPRLDKYIVKMFNWDKEYNYLLYNDSRTMLRFNAICMLFSFENYHVHTIVMSLLSLYGGVYLFKAFLPWLKDLKYLLLLAVFCIPSVMYYSSGVLKEGVLMAGLGFFFYAIFKIHSSWKQPKYWLLLILGTVILMVMKIYVFICLAPALGYYICSQRILKNNPLILFVLYNMLAFTGLYLLSVIMPDKDIFYLLYKKKDDFINVAMQYESGSFITTPDLKPNPWSFLTYIPFAVFTTIARPFIWEQGSLLIRVASIENTLLVLCMLTPFFFWKKRNLAEKKVTYFIFTFIFYLYILIGFTTPVLGALSRYKTPALPFVMILVLFFISAEKLKKIGLFKKI